MPVVTLIASSDNPGEREELKAWIRSNGPTLTFVSDNEGCGCCVDIYRVEGPQETIGRKRPVNPTPPVRSAGPGAPCGNIKRRRRVRASAGGVRCRIVS